MLNVDSKAPAVLSPLSYGATKEELFENAKAAVEAGDQSMRQAAEALATAQELHGASQTEMARAVGKSEAWVSYLLRWHRSGYREESPFGPTTKAARLQHAEDRSAGKVSPRKRNAATVNDDGAADDTVTSDGTAAHEPLPRPDEVANSSRTGVHPPDEALMNFSARIMDLKQRIGKFKPDRFAGTSTSAEDLAGLAAFLAELAQIKRRAAGHSPCSESGISLAGSNVATDDGPLQESCDTARV